MDLVKNEKNGKFEFLQDQRGTKGREMRDAVQCICFVYIANLSLTHHFFNFGNNTGVAILNKEAEKDILCGGIRIRFQSLLQIIGMIHDFSCYRWMCEHMTECKVVLQTHGWDFYASKMSSHFILSPELRTCPCPEDMSNWQDHDFWHSLLGFPILSSRYP